MMNWVYGWLHRDFHFVTCLELFLHLDHQSTCKSVEQSLGLKKCASLDSLQAALLTEQITRMSGRCSLGLLDLDDKHGVLERSRGCNNSFRAAIDRSYATEATQESVVEITEKITGDNFYIILQSIFYQKHVAYMCVK